MRHLLLFLSCGCFVLLSGCRSTSGLEVVTGFEVERYLGTWYEAARYPHRFEKDLIAVTAAYSRNADGTIKVLNRGYNPKTQAWEDAEGEARFRDDPSKGWLKVSFFKPFYASYKILYLDEAYKEAIVTGPTYNYFWILVRNPDTSKEDIDRLLDKAASFGFEMESVQRVDQSIHKES